MVNSRNKGNAYERQIVNELINDLGFDAVYTTRNESRRLDALGVDIVGVPFHIQCKAYDTKTPDYPTLLEEMPEDKSCVIFHKRNRQDTVVVMDFIYAVQLLQKSKYNIEKMDRIDKRLKSNPNFHKLLEKDEADIIQLIRIDYSPMASYIAMYKDFFYDLIDKYYD